MVEHLKIEGSDPLLAAAGAAATLVDAAAAAAAATPITAVAAGPGPLLPVVPDDTRRRQPRSSLDWHPPQDAWTYARDSLLFDLIFLSMTLDLTPAAQSIRTEESSVCTKLYQIYQLAVACRKAKIATTIRAGYAFGNRDWCCKPTRKHASHPLSVSSPSPRTQPFDRSV